jgi:hypothetical protein
MLKLFPILVLVLAFTVPAHPAIITWYGELTGDQEIPPSGAMGTGWGNVEYDTVQNTLSVYLEWADLTGPGVQAHIHCCVASPPGNVGIALDLWLPADPARPETGSYANTWDLDLVNPFRASFLSGSTADEKRDALFAAMDANEGRAYFNIHTALFPGGEIRGDLAPVPEPATSLIVVAGLGAVLLLRRRFSRA